MIDIKSGNIVFSKLHIQGVIQEVAKRIKKDFKKEFTMVPILDAAFRFTSDLLGWIDDREVRVEFLGLSSYVGVSQHKHISITKEIFPDRIEGRDIIIVDTILDSGRTLEAAERYLKTLRPHSIKRCFMIEKYFKSRTSHSDYHALQYRGSKFLVGYGTDYNGYGRNYQDIYEIYGGLK